MDDLSRPSPKLGSSQTTPQGPANAPHGSESAAETASVLTGRMLQVSRLATIGEMAAGVAHELNQPLTAIANYAQACHRLLGRADTDLEEVRSALREIASEAVRAGEILHRLRSLARSRSMQRERAGINVAIEGIRHFILAEGRMRGARILFELAQPLPPVSIDPPQIQHVILNLVRNGLEAPADETGGARELVLATSLTPEGDVEIAIRDNGAGPSAQALERMFDPFFSTKPEGTGLGLPISNTVVRAHGGSLGYRPNLPRGACFFIRLPAVPPEENDRPRA